MLTCLAGTLFAQQVYKGEAANQVADGAVLVRLKDYTAVPNYIRFTESKQLPVEKIASYLTRFYKKHKGQLGFQLVNTLEDQIGWVHYKYVQTYNGVPLHHTALFAHVKGGKVVSINGEMSDGSDITTVNFGISKEAGLKFATGHVGASVYKWELPGEEKHLKWEQEDPSATYKPTGLSVFVRKNGSLEEQLTPAYMYDVYAHEPMSRAHVFVSAVNGEILMTDEQIHEADAIGTAVTKYSGNRTITTDSLSPTNYRLRETGRGNGIRTFDLNNGSNYGNAVDFTDNNNFWNNVNPQQDEVATDAHWGAEMTYDYFWLTHNRNSIDNAGFRLDSYVHYNTNYNNAFWDGQRMTYGDGNGTTFTPLTAIDVTGHEIAHGLTNFTANLVYQNESGALNESFSDIFGACVEYYADTTKETWKIGEEMTPGGQGIRNMQNPNLHGDPDTYFGTNWYTGSADNGGVHTNSGVQNKWFYILTEGEVGTNDNNDNYNVTAQGILKASQIAFRNLTVYLSQNSQYTDARFYAIQSAVDLFGPCTPEVQATTDAWYAVGVGPAYVAGVTSAFSTPVTQACHPPFTVTFSNGSINATTFNWLFGDGGTSTQVAPSHTYTTYGTFTVELQADGGACGRDTSTILAYITIDSNLTCPRNMPQSGTDTVGECNGKLFDSGGPSANYGPNEDAVVIIKPLGAATVTTQFVSFDVEPGSASTCNFDYLEIYDGVGTTAPLLGTWCNTNGTPPILTSSQGAITIKFHSDGGLELGGFEMDWTCTYPTSAPIVNFDADVTTTCTGLIQFNDRSSNGPNQWSWDFGDGGTSTQQNPQHQYTSNGVYAVKLVASNTFGQDSITKVSYINVQMPNAPVGTNDTVPMWTNATVTATGSGQLDWYDQQVGGTFLTTGPNYITPIISATQTYWVEDVVSSPIQNLGPPNNTFGTGNNFNNNQYLVFDVFKQVELVSVLVYAQGSKNRTIELRDNNSTVLQSATVNVQNGTQRVNLNFQLQPGTDYQLGVAQGSQPDLFRNNSGCNYPYTLNNVASIKYSSAGSNPVGFYYFFYDWELREPGCISPRTPVLAVVEGTTGIEEQPLPQLSIYPNPAKEEINISLPEGIGNKGVVSILNNLGQVVQSDAYAATNGATLRVNTRSLAAGVYTVQLTSSNSKYVGRVVIRK